MQLDEMGGRRREFADQRVGRGRLYQASEIVGRRHVVRRQTGGIDVVRARHLQGGCLRVHRGDEHRRSTGIMPSERRGRAIFG